MVFTHKFNAGVCEKADASLKIHDDEETDFFEIHSTATFVNELLVNSWVPSMFCICY